MRLCINIDISHSRKRVSLREDVHGSAFTMHNLFHRHTFFERSAACAVLLAASGAARGDDG